jgi:hypothetical protein
VRRIADLMPTIAEYGARYCERGDLSRVTQCRYRGLLKLYIKGDPRASLAEGDQGKADRQRRSVSLG